MEGKEDDFKPMGVTYKRILMVKGPGVGAKATVISGFVSMFRQAQHRQAQRTEGEAGKVLGPAVPEPVEGSKGRGRGSAGSSCMEFPNRYATGRRVTRLDLALPVPIPTARDSLCLNVGRPRDFLLPDCSEAKNLARLNPIPRKS